MQCNISKCPTSDCLQKSDMIILKNMNTLAHQNCSSNKKEAYKLPTVLCNCMLSKKNSKKKRGEGGLANNIVEITRPSPSFMCLEDTGILQSS